MDSFSDLTKYYVAQVKAIGNSNIKFVFGLLFVLLIVWRGTLHELKASINEAVTYKSRADSLQQYSKMQEKRIIKIRDKDTLYIAGIPTKENVSPKYYEDLERSKTNYRDKLSSAYRIKLQADKQKSILNRKLDSIQHEVKIEFDIPTLKSVKESARIGTLLWLLLVNISLYFIILNRKNIFAYLQKLYASGVVKDNIEPADFYKFDLQLPFWLYPINLSGIKNEHYKKTFKLLINNNGLSGMSISIVIIALVFLLSLDVFLINWNLNTVIFTDAYSVYYRIAGLLFIIAFLLQTVRWFFTTDIVYAELPEAKAVLQKKLARRNFIKLAAPAMLLVLSIPSIAGRIIPAATPAPFSFRRSRKRKDSMQFNPVLNYQPGFYINRKKTVHYISDKKICYSLKTMPVKEKDAFFKNLSPLADAAGFFEKNYKTIKIQNLYWAFSNEAAALLKQNKPAQAAIILSAGIKIAAYRNHSSREELVKYSTDFLKKYRLVLPAAEKAILEDLLPSPKTVLTFKNDISPRSFKTNIHPRGR